MQVTIGIEVPRRLATSKGYNKRFLESMVKQAIRDYTEALAPREWTEWVKVEKFDKAGHEEGTERYENNQYMVFKMRVGANNPDAPGLWHLSIRNADNTARHDWRDLQRIKNELCGDECEAVEIYPAESRLVDNANQFHLWVFEEGFSLGIGFDGRLVSEGGADMTTQRPWREGERPADCIEAEQMGRLLDAYKKGKQHG